MSKIKTKYDLRDFISVLVTFYTVPQLFWNQGCWSSSAEKAVKLIKIRKDKKKNKNLKVDVGPIRNLLIYTNLIVCWTQFSFIPFSRHTFATSSISKVIQDLFTIFLSVQWFSFSALSFCFGISLHDWLPLRSPMAEM